MYSKLLNNLNAACLPLSKGGLSRRTILPSFQKIRVSFWTLSPINNKANRTVFENHFAKTVNSALTSLSRPLLSTAETT